MLEQQQSQLVHGLQEMYRRITNDEGWEGELLDIAPNGHPLTHDILERLDALAIDGHLSPDRFEEDTEILQKKLIEDDAVHIKRQSSSDSDSEEQEVPPKRHASLSKRSLTDSFLSTANRFPPTPTQTPPAFITTSPTTYGAADSLLDSAQLHVPHQLWSYPSNTYEPAIDCFDPSPPSVYNGNRHLQQQPSPCLPMPAWGDDDFGNMAFDRFDIRLRSRVQPNMN
ncbi:MAG: hypothetical protein L6R39_003378 [Caloplaca ligustica]|nr:MAG: hypothetical protein L6R39_003378 [Caloplaca ligustica]